MAIEGPLRELGIHDVFQLLDLSRKTGALRVTSDLRDDEGVVLFDGGRVVLVESVAVEGGCPSCGVMSSRIKDRPEGYVRQVLARESVNRWRDRRWREVTTDMVPEAMHHDSTDRISLLEDLLRLSPRQRAVLVLRYFDDLTEADTAAALGISVGTVKSHARDALARLSNQPLGEERSAAKT